MSLTDFRIDLHGAYLPSTRWVGTNFLDANLKRTRLSHAIMREANFRNADLDGAILDGADLTGARNLTEEQLSRAVIDDTTVLPDYIDRARIEALRETVAAE